MLTSDRNEPAVAASSGVVNPGDGRRHAYYPMLDGMRGLAAIVVMLFHFMSYFGVWGWGHPGSWATPFKCGPLAVDFFFMLSGFVLSSAYASEFDCRLEPLAFMGKRLTRLYPMYAIGMVIGIVAIIATFLFGARLSIESFQWHNFAATVAFSAMMIPDYFGKYGMILGSPRLEGAAFPLNPPGWSLFFELVASMMLIVLWKRSDRFLLGLVTLSFSIMLAWTPITMLLLNQPARTYFFAGGSRSDLWLGLSRATTGFFAGVLLYRWRATGRLDWLNSTGWHGPLIAYVVLTISLAMPISWKSFGPPLFLTVISPLLIVWGSQPDQATPGTWRLSRWLGWISFPLYCVHFPAGQIVWLGCRHYGLSPALAFAGATALSFLIASISSRAIEEPVRRFIGRQNRHRVANASAITT